MSELTAENILGGTDEDSSHQRSSTESGNVGRSLSGEEGEREETDTGDTENDGRNQRSDTPSVLAEDGATGKHHEQSNKTGDGREITHEGRVRVRVGEGLAQVGLPRNLNNVDRHSVGDNDSSKVSNVGRLDEILGRVCEAELGLGLLGLAFPRLEDVRVCEDVRVHVAVAGHDDTTTNNDCSHEVAERDCPAINASGKVLTHIRHKAHVLTGEDEGNVGAKTEEGVVLLRLGHRHGLVGETPEEQTDNARSPQLGTARNEHNGRRE